MDQSGAEDCFSRPWVKGDLVWGALEAWPSIMSTVLSGTGAVFSRPLAMGVILNPNK